jgi:hypothetical protein
MEVRGVTYQQFPVKYIFILAYYVFNTLVYMQSLTIFEELYRVLLFYGAQYYIFSGVPTKDWQKHDKIRFVRWVCTARRQLACLTFSIFGIQLSDPREVKPVI